MSYADQVVALPMGTLVLAVGVVLLAEPERFHTVPTIGFAGPDVLERLFGRRGSLWVERA